MPKTHLRKKNLTAKQQLDLAKEHLGRVQGSWDPPDWSDLSMYGFYCLENAVSAAAMHSKIRFERSHVGKIEAAKKLAAKHGFKDVSDLLVELNDSRKSFAYGDVDAPDLDEEDLVDTLEQYVQTVENFLS